MQVTAVTTDLDEILDDLFHGCAFAAFVEQAIAQGGPPDREATRRPGLSLLRGSIGGEKSPQRLTGSTRPGFPSPVTLALSVRLR